MIKFKNKPFFSRLMAEYKFEYQKKHVVYPSDILSYGMKVEARDFLEAARKGLEAAKKAEHGMHYVLWYAKVIETDRQKKTHDIVRAGKQLIDLSTGRQLPPLENLVRA